jgi:hypothetical protein
MSFSVGKCATISPLSAKTRTGTRDNAAVLPLFHADRLE